jgi:hypothetical protein
VSPEGGIYHQSIIKTLFRSMYYTIGALVQRDAAFLTETIFARLQTIFVWLMSFILIALFTSNMVQYFATEYEKPWIQSIEDLRMCRKVVCSRIGVVENSQHADYIKENNIAMDYYPLKHPNEAYTKLLNYSIDVAIADSSSADYFTQNEYCDLEEAGLPFGRTDFSIVIPKNWPYKSELDKTITDLKASRNFDYLMAKWFEQKNCDRKNAINYNGFGDGLTLTQTQGLFYIFSAFTFINIVGFILQQLGFFSYIHYLVNKIKNYVRSPSISSLDKQSTDVGTHRNDLSGNNKETRQQMAPIEN